MQNKQVGKVRYTATYVFVYDNDRLIKLKDELTNLLFDKSYTITKPMIDNLAIYVYHKEDRANFKTVMTTSSQQPHLREFIGGQDDKRYIF